MMALKGLSTGLRFGSNIFRFYERCNHRMENGMSEYLRQNLDVVHQEPEHVVLVAAGLLLF